MDPINTTVKSGWSAKMPTPDEVEAALTQFAASLPESVVVRAAFDKAVAQKVRQMVGLVALHGLLAGGAQANVGFRADKIAKELLKQWEVPLE